MLVSGVWRLWLTPRRKSSLAASSSSSWRFCVSTVANSCALRIAAAISFANSSSRSWSAGSQRRVAGSRPMSTPMSVAAGAHAPPAAGRDTPGTTSSSSTIDGSPMTTVASISANADVASARRPVDQRLDVVARRDLVDRREDPPELPVAPPEVGGQSVVALGQPRELVVAGDPDRGREVARRHAVDGRGHGAQRRRELVARARTRRGSRTPARWRARTAGADRGSCRPRGRPSSVPRISTTTPKTASGSDRRDDEGDGEAGPEAQARGAAPVGALVVSHGPRSPARRSRRRRSGASATPASPPVDSPRRARSGRASAGSASTSTFWRSRRIVTQT